MSTQTVTQALNAIPASHPAYPIAQTCLGKLTLAATANTTHALAAKTELRSLLQQVVDSLMESGTLPPASVLAGLTFHIQDCGALGTMNVATLASVGAY